MFLIPECSFHDSAFSTTTVLADLSQTLAKLLTY